MAEIGINKSIGGKTKLKKWEPVNLIYAALALAADGWVSYSGELSGTRAYTKIVAFGVLMLLVIDYKIAKRLVDVFNSWNAKSSTLGLLRVNMLAVIAVGGFSCLSVFDNILGIGLESILDIASGISGLVLLLTQLFVSISLLNIGQLKLGASIISFMLFNVIIGLILDSGYLSGFTLYIATGLNIIIGLWMYWQYNAFFGKSSRNWDNFDNIGIF